MSLQTANAISPAQRHVFDRRAATFDQVAFLPREIASRMAERLDYIVHAPRQLMDLGCGAGRDLSLLRSRYPDAVLTGLDASLGMLREGVRREPLLQAPVRRAPAWMPRAVSRAIGRLGAGAQGDRGSGVPVSLVQGDFAAPPFAAQTFDMLWSNLALQWHPRPDLVFPEWARIAAPNALLMFSTLGPDTLREVRTACRAIDHPAPVLDFVDMHDLGDMLGASGFALPVMDMETLTVTYREPEALLADVRRWGAFLPRYRHADAAAVPAGASVGSAAVGALAPADDTLPRPSAGADRWLSPARYRDLLAALAAQRRADGTLALTFEVVYGHAWRGAPRARAESAVRVEDIGGRGHGRGGVASAG